MSGRVKETKFYGECNPPVVCWAAERAILYLYISILYNK